MDKLEFKGVIGSHMGLLKTNALMFTGDHNDADDLVQDTLIKAFRFSENFRSGTNLKGWLFFIMRNTFINKYRKMANSKLVFGIENESNIQFRPDVSTQNAANGKLMLEEIHKAIDALPELYKYAFIRYFEGYKYGEIADELNIPLGTVKTYIYMARTLLKKQLKPYRTE